MRSFRRGTLMMLGSGLVVGLLPMIVLAFLGEHPEMRIGHAGTPLLRQNGGLVLSVRIAVGAFVVAGAFTGVLVWLAGPSAHRSEGPSLVGAQPHGAGRPPGSRGRLPWVVCVVASDLMAVVATLSAVHRAVPVARNLGVSPSAALLELAPLVLGIVGLLAVGVGALLWPSATPRATPG